MGAGSRCRCNSSSTPNRRENSRERDGNSPLSSSSKACAFGISFKAARDCRDSFGSPGRRSNSKLSPFPLLQESSCSSFTSSFAVGLFLLLVKALQGSARLCNSATIRLRGQTDCCVLFLSLVILVLRRCCEVGDSTALPVVQDDARRRVDVLGAAPQSPQSLRCRGRGLLPKKTETLDSGLERGRRAASPPFTSFPIFFPKMLRNSSLS